MRFAFALLLSLFLTSCAEFQFPQIPQRANRSHDIESINKKLDGLMADRANRAVAIDDLRAEIQLLSGEIDSTKHSTEDKVALLDEKIENLSERLFKIERQQDGVGEKRADWKSLWDEGERAFSRKEYSEAVGVYRKLLKEYPYSPVAPKARFNLAESIFSREKYSDAILEYEELKKAFPSSPYIPKAYLQQARAFSKLRKIKEAKLFYTKLQELYPKSREAKAASSELKKLK